MKRALQKRRRAAMVKACYVSALVNSLLSIGYGQEATDQNGEEPAPLRYGPFDIRPHVRAGIVYDDNIFIRPNNKQSDVIWTLSPGGTLGTGDYNVKEENFSTISYTPSFILFTENGSNSAVDHDAQLRLQYHPGKWTVALGQDYQAMSGAVIDVGNRVSRDIYTTALSIKYEISPKTSVELTGTQSINDYETVVNFNEWIVGGWVDYSVTPKVKIGVGANGGFVDIQQSANQQYQQGLVRATYSMTEKVEGRASAGFELRQFDGGKDKNTPVFSLGGTYTPLENTSISVDAYRRNQNSISLVDQNFIVTGGSVGVRQAVFVKYALYLAGGYDHAEYSPTVATTSNTRLREDNYFYVRTGVDCKLMDRLTAGAFYQYRRNNSNLDFFKFDNNQFGLSLAYQF